MVKEDDRFCTFIRHETGINKNDSECLVDSDARDDSESHGSHGSHDGHDGHISHVCTTVTAVTVVTSASDPARRRRPCRRVWQDSSTASGSNRSLPIRPRSCARGRRRRAHRLRSQAPVLRARPARAARRCTLSGDSIRIYSTHRTQRSLRFPSYLSLTPCASDHALFPCHKSRQRTIASDLIINKKDHDSTKMR
jgi:hypothetical protein